MTSEDVIQSFFMRRFRIAQGRPRHSHGKGQSKRVIGLIERNQSRSQKLAEQSYPTRSRVLAGSTALNR